MPSSAGVFVSCSAETQVVDSAVALAHAHVAALKDSSYAGSASSTL